MCPDSYVDILREAGFQLIGKLDYRLHATIWWHADKLVQIIVVCAGRTALIKGDKSYFLKSVTVEGETWARDIGPLHDYLEAHFPELRIAFSHFRDVPKELAELEVRRRTSIYAPTQSIPTVDELANLQRRLYEKQKGAASVTHIQSFFAGAADLLSSHLREKTTSRGREIKQLAAEVECHKKRLSLMQQLQREYTNKGSAATYTFSINSNLQVASDPPQFRDSVQAVVKELLDLHRHQVTQKLQGGRLNIQVAEASEPSLVWIEQWFGGSLTPMQSQKLGPEFAALREAANEHTMVLPDDAISVEGHHRNEGKHLGARCLSTILQRLDKTDAATNKDPLDPKSMSRQSMPIGLGQRVDVSGKMVGPAVFPLTHFIHSHISGTTGGGKSYLARVLIEEAAQQEGLNVLVLDPRNQSIGLLIPEDRPHILEQYGDFGMRPESARGFTFNYHSPAMPVAAPMPQNLSSLARGRSIVSFKGCDDQQRCALAAKILDAVFEACTVSESDKPRLLVVVDEAQLFTRKRVDESAKEGVAQVERAIDRITREGRKFGVLISLVSISMRDFSHELASVRQLIATRIFLRNADREIDVAADFIGDGRLLVQLPTGTALIHNANWGVTRIRVRPPLSKVFELSDAETYRLIDSSPFAKAVSADASRLVATIKAHGGRADDVLNMSRAAELSGVSSKRKFIQLVNELEAAGVIRTRKLPDRGQPRIIELVDPLNLPMPYESEG